MGCYLVVTKRIFISSKSTMCKICSKVTIKTQERRQRRRSGVYTPETDFTHYSCVSNIDFDQVNAD